MSNRTGFTVEQIVWRTPGAIESYAHTEPDNQKRYDVTGEITRTQYLPILDEVTPVDVPDKTTELDFVPASQSETTAETTAKSEIDTEKRVSFLRRILNKAMRRPGSKIEIPAIEAGAVHETPVGSYGTSQPQQPTNTESIPGSGVTRQRINTAETPVAEAEHEPETNYKLHPNETLSGKRERLTVLLEADKRKRERKGPRTFADLDGNEAIDFLERIRDGLHKLPLSPSTEQETVPVTISDQRVDVSNVEDFVRGMEEAAAKTTPIPVAAMQRAGTLAVAESCKSIATIPDPDQIFTDTIDPRLATRFADQALESNAPTLYTKFLSNLAGADSTGEIITNYRQAMGIEERMN